MIEVRELSKKYNSDYIFKNINFKISRGEMIALIGPSGVGKSTLLNIIGSLESFEEGEVLIDGEKINHKQNIKLLRDKFGFLFQNYALIDQETVSKNLDIALKFTKNINKEELKQQVMSKVGLMDKMNNRIYELSGGEQQRVALARLMLKPCEIILADEPTGALDSENRDMVLRFLKELNQEGKTLLVVTHDPYVAEFCDRKIELSS
ncbi:putative bacteriocin export ABC transporter [Bacillus cereus group sp. BfR-BA-01310]|uniref:putative bacteriocin export ABC transporter n=1 Tax=Bacillus cereus group sp. BfR-BA-01310 TaxID=2920287 RepID=UPI001F598683|nr:putative bacteriocin export ABC transporter [Bacillus cereus group sp. BfR-BA-01310]